MQNKLNEMLMPVSIKENKMINNYQFTLILDSVDENTPNLEDALFEAGCDDALINFKNGIVSLDFDRCGSDFEQTILSAIKNIESSGIGASISMVTPDHFVNLTDIANRVGLTKQALSLYVLGKRGNGSFPKPTLKIYNKSPLWRWNTVAEWFYKQGKIKNYQVVNHANIVNDINGALDMRTNKESFHHKKQILANL